MSLKDRNKRIEYKKKYYYSNLEKERSSRYQYYLKHKPEYIERQRKYRKENPEKYRKKSRDGAARNYSLNTEALLKHLKVSAVTCKRCGYNEHFGSIDAHHLDPSQKESNRDTMSDWMSRSPRLFMDKILTHKLMFLCRNCHTSLHAGVWKLEEING